MKTLAWWRRALLLSLLSLAFSILCVFASSWTLANFSKEMRTETQKYMATYINAPTVDEMRQRARVAATARGASNLIAFRVWVVNQAGEVVATTENKPLPIDWARAPKPEQVSTYATAYQEGAFGRQINVFRLPADEPLWMVNDTLPPGSLGQRLGRAFVLFFVLNIIGNAVLGSVSFVLISRWKGRQASEVLAEFGRGNLKARFPMTKADEFGHLMVEFNRMASTIEEVLTKLRNAESARRALLQDINHDFRTPLATLEIVMERLGEYHDRMPSEKRSQAIAGAVRELEYLKRLTEFLFTLAESDEPAYRVSFETQNLREVLEAELNQRRSAGLERSRHLKWELAGGLASCPIEGDRSLIVRLVRNGLDNAARYAKEKVSIVLGEDGKHWTVTILDDGPGPSDEGLAKFGRRKAATVVALSLDPSESAGLGSVIMRAIASLHGGDVELQPRADGASGGALVIRLPKGAEAPALLSA